MKILIACEESQAICIAFRDRGHAAYSCDIQPCSGGHPEWHIQDDVLKYLDMGWDMIIAHPPCTYLSNAGAVRLYPKKGEINNERYEKGLEAKKFFMRFFTVKCDKLCIENPIPLLIYGLPKYNQIIQPYEYGHPFQKKTCLWLRGLPKLQPTNIITGDVISWVSGGTKDNKGLPRKNKGTIFRNSVIRSKTFKGIAAAMAEQWVF